MSTTEDEETHISDGKLSRQGLKSLTGEFDIESIHVLKIKKRDVSDLGCIGECVNLQFVDLSYNNVSKLFALAGLTNIIYLNLSANRISSLEGLQSLDNLKDLNIAGNLLSSIDNLRCLMSLEHLEVLRLKDDVKGISNPMCMNISYRNDVINILPKLRTLDGEILRGKGCDIFKMMSEIEQSFNGKNNDDVNLENSLKPGPWFSPGYLSLTNSHVTKGFEDAENQFRELLNDCNRMLTEAGLTVADCSKNTKGEEN